MYLLRPDPQVIWKSQIDLFAYPKLNAYYKRSEKGGGGWKIVKPIPDEWNISYDTLSLQFKIKPMGFKHTGLFSRTGSQLGIHDAAYSKRQPPD